MCVVLYLSKCICQLIGFRPFLTYKYDITRHPNYKYLADSDKKNALDIGRFLSAKLAIKKKEVFDVYQVDMNETTKTTIKT